MTILASAQKISKNALKEKQLAERAELSRMFTKAMYEGNYDVVRACIGSGMDYVVDPQNPNDNIARHNDIQRALSPNSLLRQLYDKNGEADKFKKVSLEDLLLDKSSMSPLPQRMLAFIKSQLKIYEIKKQKAKRKRLPKVSELEATKKEEDEKARRLGDKLVFSLVHDIEKAAEGVTHAIFRTGNTGEIKAFNAAEIRSALQALAAQGAEGRKKLGYGALPTGAPYDFNPDSLSDNELKDLTLRLEKNRAAPYEGLPEVGLDQLSANRAALAPKPSFGAGKKKKNEEPSPAEILLGQKIKREEGGGNSSYPDSLHVDGVFKPPTESSEDVETSSSYRRGT